MPIPTYLSQFFKPIHLQIIIRTANLLTFCKPMPLPFIVRKTLRLRVYVASISNEFYFSSNKINVRFVPQLLVVCIA